MASKTKDEVKNSSGIDMTPAIDCTFNLLIFFLCNINFKLLEGKIPAYLPKDVGVNASPVSKQLEKIEIEVRRRQVVETKEKNWIWQEGQIEIRVQGRPVAGLRQFHDMIKAAHEANPEAKATLYPNQEALYIDCVKVINECLRAKFLDITFGGTRMDS